MINNTIYIIILRERLWTNVAFLVAKSGINYVIFCRRILHKKGFTPNNCYHIQPN